MTQGVDRRDDTAFAPPPRDRERYFLAAYQLLAEGGCAAVTVAALCERVGVTKGSFYHHFADLPQFVAAFADRWLAWVTSLFEGYLAEPDPVRRLEIAANRQILLMTGSEPAIRGWGRTNPTIADAVRAVDRLGHHFGEVTYTALIGDAETATMLTRIGVAGLIGMQQRSEPVDADRLLRIMAEWFGRCVHLESELIRIDGRLHLRLLGPSGVPVPTYRRPTVLSGPPGEAAVERAVAEAAARLTPEGDRGREAYFRAAREILAEQGSDGVTASALCDRLSVTKGSFQYHFGTMPGFVEALAQQWEQAFVGLVETYDGVPDPLRRLERAFQAVFTLPHPTEAAWRAWGWKDPVVAAASRRAENAAERKLFEVLRHILEDSETAALVAEFGTGVAIGLTIHDPPLAAEEFGLAGLEWARYCAGLDAELVMIDGVPRLSVSRP